MDHFAGLDVSVKETSVCIVDETGKIVREVKLASEPDALAAVLANPAYHFKRIGLEAGPLSQWLYSALAEAGLPVICVETRHMRALLKAQINKTDRNDARGIAQMMRVGLYRPVHVKTLRSQKLRMLLTHRKLLQSKAIAIDNDLRGTLRNFGLKVGVVSAMKFEARIKELVENFPDLAVMVEPLLIVRRVLREQIGILHRRLLAVVRDDEVMWLVGRLAPDHKTIADFRKDNGRAIRKVCAHFIALCRAMGLLTHASVAIDGSKFKAVNNRDKNFTRAKMERRMAQIERASHAICSNSTRRTGRSRQRRCKPRPTVSKRRSRR